MSPILGVMRALALALGAALLAVPHSAAGDSDAKLLYVHGKRALIVYVGHPLRQPILLERTGVPHWSGDGRLISIGGYVVGRAQLPTTEVTWAPTGELAAYATKEGGVSVWTPARGREQVVPDGWGAQSLAWSRTGALALGRAVCHGACGRPSHKEIWVWRRGGSLRRVVGPLTGDQTPMPFAWQGGHVLWWDWPNSGSIAADGVALYEDRHRIAHALMYRDYADVCGSHFAVAAGGDRYAMHGKRVLFDGHDVSRDPSRSWVSPSCLPNGTLMAAASKNAVPNRIGREARSIWRLLPTRRELTRPPAGWTDETPRLLPDGSVLFVRTRQTSRKVDGEWMTTTRGRIELLSRGKLTEVTEVQFSARDSSGDWLNYYGHYDWPSRLAVSP
jgi:hypothetical protein